MIPYFQKTAMLAKITSKNQLTLPKAVTQAVGATDYFEVEARAGQIILTPVRIQRGDAVRAKLAELALTEEDMTEAVAWARSAALAHVALTAEPTARYDSGSMDVAAAGKQALRKVAAPAKSPARRAANPKSASRK